MCGNVSEVSSRMTHNDLDFAGFNFLKAIEQSLKFTNPSRFKYRCQFVFVVAVFKLAGNCGRCVNKFRITEPG